MKAKITLKTIISLVLCFAVAVTFIPAFSYAAETQNPDSATAGTITAFEDLETSDYYFEGNPTEEQLTANLPEKLKVHLDGSDSVTSIPVKWEAVEDYDKTDFYFYSLKPVWGSSYVLSDKLSELWNVPWITVYKQEPKSDDIEPIMTEDELDPVYTIKDGAVDPETYDSGNTARAIRDFFVSDVYAGTVENTELIYKFLTKTMGLNKAAACGVMTNINAESGMSPINLQNTYNENGSKKSVIGLSDAEYTKRVDAGKGAYKNVAGEKRNFKTDYPAGYGLCQWTSNGRRENLLNKALDDGKSVGDMQMQLEFLKYELETNYSGVLKTLKSVPNNATGAYIAAAQMCIAFEVPANTVATAASRGKTCLLGYWKTYTGKTVDVSSVSFLSLCGYAVPTNVKTGKGVTTYGYVISNHNITSVNGKVLDSKGNSVYSKTFKPEKTAYSLSKNKNLNGTETCMDDYILFSKLSAGSYTYKITAKDTSGATVKVSHDFKVTSTGSTTWVRNFATNTSEQNTEPVETKPAEPKSTLKITNYTYPKSIKKGKPFTLKGTVKSNYNLKKVTIGVYTTKGKVKQSASKTISKKKSYSIKELDPKIKFGKLAKGTYYYKVIATDTKNKKTVLKKKFTVK